jgi:hypothetical protein
MKTSKFMMVLFALSSFTTIAFAQTKNIADSELKKNTAPITGALGYINQMQPVTYQYDTQQYKNLKLPVGTQYGFNANDVERVLPGLVKKESVLYPAGKNQYRSADITKVDIQSLVPVLLGAIKEQQQQIEDLKAEVKSLKQNTPSTAAVVR